MSRTTMEFRIADTFTDSLARLTGDEQKAVKTWGYVAKYDNLVPLPASAGARGRAARQRRASA